MNELKEHIQSISEVLKEECAKIAFWKENKHWYSYIFKLTKNDVLTEFDKKFLEDIQKDDPKAVIVDSRIFIKSNGDGSILVDEMVNSVFYLYVNKKANISGFLERYAEEKQQQEIDRSSLKEVVKHCWDRLWKERYSKAVFWKKDECWHYYMFYFPLDNVFPMKFEKTLKKIKVKDQNAIVIDGYYFRQFDGDDAAKYIAEEIEKYRQDKRDSHNIGVFLDKYSWSAVVDKNKEKQQEEQQRHWTMERSEIVEIMENALKNLRDLSLQCSSINEYFAISNCMLEIAKYLTYQQE